MYRSTWIRRISTSAIIMTMASFGVTSVASAQTITNTGTGSTNRISDSATNNCTVTNNNNISATNRNNQTATSGNTTVSGNTTAGAAWSGWSEYDPAASQTNGVSYASWRAGVTDWISQRASGNGWNSTETNLSWTPTSSDWTGYDPLAWQSNGQSFGNWYNAVQSYLNNNSAAWIMGWPADATGSGNFGGASSGNALNTNNVNFTIAINNAASAAAGTNSCGKSNFTPPPATGGMGGGTWTPPVNGGSVLGASTAVSGSGGAGGAYHPATSYGGRYSGGSYHAPASTPTVYTPPAVSNPAPTTPVTPSAGGTGSGLNGTISTTGTDSHNTISSTYTNNSTVTNTNNVSYNNSNTQTATTGNSTVTGNTSTWSASSGDGTNANGSAGSVTLGN